MNESEKVNEKRLKKVARTNSLRNGDGSSTLVDVKCKICQGLGHSSARSPPLP